MTEELHTETEGLLITLNKVIDKELAFVSNPANNWTEISDFKKKEDTHDLHLHFTKRSVSYADKLLGIASKNGDQDKREVKEMLKKLSRFFTIYDNNYFSYIETQDWTVMLATEMSGGEKEGDTSIGKELKFQSNLTQHLADMRSVMLKIAKLEDKSYIKIPIFNDRPAPFLMDEAFEEKFSELKDVMEEKRTSWNKPEKVAKKK